MKTATLTLLAVLAVAAAIGVSAGETGDTIVLALLNVHIFTISPP